MITTRHYRMEINKVVNEWHTDDTDWAGMNGFCILTKEPVIIRLIRVICVPLRSIL
jgi:hypothetical protein